MMASLSVIVREGERDSNGDLESLNSNKVWEKTKEKEREKERDRERERERNKGALPPPDSRHAEIVARSQPQQDDRNL